MALLQNFDIEANLKQIDKRAQYVKNLCDEFITKTDTYYNTVEAESQIEETDTDDVLKNKIGGLYTVYSNRMLRAEGCGNRLLAYGGKMQSTLQGATQQLSKAKEASSGSDCTAIIQRVQGDLIKVQDLHTKTFGSAENSELVVEELSDGEAAIVKLKALKYDYPEQFVEVVADVGADVVENKITQVENTIVKAKKVCDLAYSYKNEVERLNTELDGLRERIATFEQEARKNAFEHRFKENGSAFQQAKSCQGGNKTQQGYSDYNTGARDFKTAADMFDRRGNGCEVPKPLSMEDGGSGEVTDSSGAKVITRSMGGNYYGRRSLTMQILESIWDYFGASGGDVSDLGLFTSYGYNKNGNILVNDKIFSVNYTSGMVDVPEAVAELIKSGNWSEIMAIDFELSGYLQGVQRLTFATNNQLRQFAQNLGVSGVYPQAIAIKLRDKRRKMKRLFPKLMSIEVSGVEMLLGDEVTPEAEQRVAEVSRKMDKASMLADTLNSGVQLPSLNIKTKLKQLYDYPIVKVVSKVFGYGVGVPFGFTLLSMMHPFALVCGALGVGVLGVMEYKKARNFLNS